MAPRCGYRWWVKTSYI